MIIMKFSTQPFSLAYDERIAVFVFTSNAISVKNMMPLH